MRLHSFQHIPFETLAMIEDWALVRGHSLSATHFFEADFCLPGAQDYDALVVMGGPMGIHDYKEHPWLKSEKEHIQVAIEAGKPVLGVCLGAQLIAHVLGAEVKPNIHKEIGWMPIKMSGEAAYHPIASDLPEIFTVLHWHGDRFDIPKGAIPLASSDACENQGFLFNDKILGLQFHLEMNQEAITRIVEACADDLEADGAYVQSAQDILTGYPVHGTQAILFQMLDNWGECIGVA
ncbi:MAG: type 1 glutamine amidotransferase [Pseudomonadota bacterium]